MDPLSEEVSGVSRRWSLSRMCRMVLTGAVISATLSAGCALAPTGAEPPAGDAAGDLGRVPRASYAALEGLVFVRDGAIWAVESGVPHAVIEEAEPWSLRPSRSGEAITYLSCSTTCARLQTAIRGDWRAESIWESELGTLIAEAVHDDVSDMLWLTVSGEATTTVAVCDLGNAGQLTALDLPVSVGPHFSVRFEDGKLIAPGAAQEPAHLYLFEPGPKSLFTTSSLFTPRLSPDGLRVVVTGSTTSGGLLRLWSIGMEDGAVVELDTGPGTAADPAWSSDGERVAFRDTETGTVWTVPAAGGPATNSGLRADEGGLVW